MKVKLLLLSVLISQFLCAQHTYTAEGVYQGKNIYIQNPFNDDGIGFCIDSLFINDEKYQGNFASSAFELRLDSMNFTAGDSIHIRFNHGSNCLPRILRPNYCYFPHATYESVQLDKFGLLKWSYKSSTPHSFKVEQYRWNRWIQLDEIIGDTSGLIHDYSFQCNLHSGENTIRILYKDKQTSMYNSPVELSVESGKTRATGKYIRKENKVEFSEVTGFQIYSAYGEIVKEGRADGIDLTELKRGKYYINFDNETGLKVHRR